MAARAGAGAGRASRLAMDWMSNLNLWRAGGKRGDRSHPIPIPLPKSRSRLPKTGETERPSRSYRSQPASQPARKPGWIAGNAAVESTSILVCGIMVGFYLLSRASERPDLKRKDCPPSIGRHPTTKLGSPVSALWARGSMPFLRRMKIQECPNLGVPGVSHFWGKFWGLLQQKVSALPATARICFFGFF